MSYIPSKDAELLLWGSNITNLLTADPPRYGVTAGESSLVQGEFDDMEAAMNTANDPSTRSPSSVAHKDGLKALFLADIRALSGIIRANRGVSNEDKAALGLSIPDPTPTPIPTPTSSPIFSILSATPSNHTVTFKDPDQPAGKAKPFGVMQVLVYRKIDTVPHTDFDTADPRLCTVITKTPSLLTIPGGSRGKVATYWAQWLTRTGLLGPMSNAISFACP